MSTASSKPLKPNFPVGAAALETQALRTQGLCQVALEAWRIARLVHRICDADRTRVQAIADRLREGLGRAGVEIQDHTNQPYVEGLAVEILSTEDRADLAPGILQIVETVKPSVYIAGQLVTQGQVIVGRGLGTDTGRAYGADDH